jgi:hypothetical protein
MKKILVLAFFVAACIGKSQAQIDLKKIFDIDDILGKVLNVKKGFAPKFSLGNQPITKIFKVGEILGLKKNDQVDKYFRMFKTGRTIYKIAAYAGTAISVYGAVKGIDKAAAKKDYQGAIIGGLSTIGTGLLTKFLTKAASYKAVDIFNGVVKRKLGDILGVAPASSTIGVGVYVKL